MSYIQSTVTTFWWYFVHMYVEIVQGITIIMQFLAVVV